MMSYTTARMTHNKNGEHDNDDEDGYTDDAMPADEFINEMFGDSSDKEEFTGF